MPMKKFTASVLLVIFAASSAFGFKIDFLTKKGEPIHEGITDVALRSLPIRLGNWTNVTFSDDAIKYVAEKNTENDEKNFDVPALHFDEERFSESNDLLIGFKSKVVDLLLKLNAKPADIDKARTALGNALHLVQDFYAHSNWVENKKTNPLLMLPRLGHPAAFAQWQMLGVHYEDFQTTACVKNSYAPGSPLTTGYYTWAMHDLGYQNAATDTQAERDALGLYTDEWVKAVPDLTWQTGRCIHGGDTGPGMNHDHEGRENFAEARAYAIQASQSYLQDVFLEIRSRGGNSADQAICALLGSKDVACTQPVTPNLTVDTVSFDESTPKRVDSKFVVKVSGAALPPNLSVFLGDFQCTRTFTPDPKTAIEVECTPLVHGHQDIRVLSGAGILLKSKDVFVQLAAVAFSPAVTKVLAEVEFWVTNVSHKAKAVVWSFVDAVGSLVTSTRVGVENIVRYVFETAGDKIVNLVFEDEEKENLGEIAFKLNVSAADVTTVAAISSVKNAAGAEIPNASSTTERRPRFSGTLGAALPNQFFFAEVLMDGASIGRATVSGTAWTFVPPGDLALGAHVFTARVARGDGVYGAESAPRRLTVAREVPVPPSLLAYYPFDGSLADGVRIGVAGQLTVVGTVPVFEAGRNALAVALTPPAAANGSYLRGGPLVTKDTAFTISAWIKPNGINATGFSALVYQRTDSGGIAPGCAGNAYNFGLTIYQGKWYFQVSTMDGMNCVYGDIIGTAMAVAGRYAHVAGVYDKAARKILLYVDGALVGEKPVGPNFRLTPNMVATIGNQPWAQPTQPGNATIDELKVFEGALSAAEVSALAAVPASPAVFIDEFGIGTVLDPAKWTARTLVSGNYGVPNVVDGLAHIAYCQYADTAGKVAISGGRIVIESRFAGQKAGGRDTNISLRDPVTGSWLQFGDTDYRGWGKYLHLSTNGVYDYIGSFGGTTSAFKEYRVTLEGKNVTIERGDSLSRLNEISTVVMPRSVTSGTYHLRIGTGGCDGIYSPADFDWVRIYVGS